MADAKENQVENKSVKFSTLSGVFIPSVLAIFGAVIYFILPRTLGGVGLIKMLVIIMIAHSITIATSFSISAIASNIKVKGGGLYYLISRTLGSEFGGTMGIQLFLAQTISISFYVIAFTKVIVGILAFFNIVFNEVYIAVISFIFFWIIAFMGARFVIRLQYIILGALLLSFVSIFIAPNPMLPMYDFFGLDGVPLAFWVAFIMFFPAVTGMDAGVGMSGDLKDPKKSLKVGSFASIFFTLFVYIALTVKLFVSATPDELSNDIFIVQKIAYVPALVVLGVFLSTSSSALSYLMTAPRTLKALITDRIISKKFKFFAKSIGKSTEPRMAMFVVLVIGLVVILTGGLFIVSQIVGIFFLTVYGWVNGAVFLENLSKNPSFRPSFKSPMIISLYGLVACCITMFLFNKWVTLAALIFQLLIFIILIKTKTSRNLESVWMGVLFQMYRNTFRWLENTDKSKINWRPNILAFCTNERNKVSIATFLSWVGLKRTITKLFILVSKYLKKEDKDFDKINEEINELITKDDIRLFPKLILCNDYNENFRSIVQSQAIGTLPFNTVLIDFDEQFDIHTVINDSKDLNKNILILRAQPGIPIYKNIDVWWSSSANGNMMILFAHMISHSKQWRSEDANINVYSVVETKKEHDSLKETLNRIKENARIDNISFEVIMRGGLKRIVDSPHPRTTRSNE